jgi:GntR family transcriptional regulator/MocR family aminotransferase
MVVMGLSTVDLQGLEGKRLGYLELSNSIIEAITSGRLPVNSSLPPSRDFAQTLGVSRDTIVRCYEHLKSLGWIESHGKIGMFVTDTAKLSSPTEQPITLSHKSLSNYGIGLLADQVADTGIRPSGHDPIRFGVVPKSNIPTARWKKALQNFSAPSAQPDLGYIADVLGRSELRQAFATFMCCNRKVFCTSNEIVVFNGSFSALSLICRIFLEPGDSIAIENPGFGGPKSAAAYLGLNVVPIALDAEGISIKSLEQSSDSIKLVYVTPNHQEPSGITMTFARRKQLLSWAQKNSALIIEDDHDGLFHYGTDMPPSLKSMDTQDNVIYLTGFWQILYPLTAMCLAVVPQSICEVMKSAKIHTANLTEHQPQLALSELLSAGYLQRHISKLERDLAPKRRALIYELKRIFGKQVHVPLHSGGVKIMVQFSGFSDTELIESARAANLTLASTADFYALNEIRSEGECLIYFPDLEEAHVRKKIESFAQHLHHQNNSGH